MSLSTVVLYHYVRFEILVMGEYNVKRVVDQEIHHSRLLPTVHEITVEAIVQDFEECFESEKC